VIFTVTYDFSPRFLFTHAVVITLTIWQNVSVKGTKIIKLEDIINLANQNNGYLTPELIKNNEIYTLYIHRFVIAEELYKIIAL